VVAQTTYTVSGTVKDSAGKEIIGGNILLIAGKDTLHTTSNETGQFRFTNVNQPVFTLRINTLGYETWYREFRFQESGIQINLPLIVLTMKINTLKEVVVKGKRSPIIKGDTTEYSVDQYDLRENSVVEDLLKRLPGIQVDRDGNITAMGKEISTIRINGKDILIDDIKSLTRLLPTDLIGKIQLIDDYGDMARATGRKTGEPDKVINIQTKGDLNKIYQAQAIAGAGNDDRYNATVLGNYFSEKQQLTLNGITNNISAQTGSTVTTKGNINYRGFYSKEFSVNVGVLGGLTTNHLQSNSNVETVTNDGILYSINNSNNSNRNENFNFTGGAVYKPREADMVNFNIGFNTNNIVNSNILSAIQSGFQRKDQITFTNNNNHLPALMSGLFATHRFKKYGRVLSLGININSTQNDNDQDSQDSIRYYKPDNSVAKDSLLHQLLRKINNTLSTNAQISWIEPLDSTTSLELKYVLNRTYTDNKQETQWINSNGKKNLIDSLSNHYQYAMTQHQVELNYRKNKGKFDYTIGVRVLPSGIRGNTLYGMQYVVIQNSPVVPVFRVQYTLPHAAMLTLAYNGNTTFPSYQQLQPVPDLSNPQSPIIGNPNLSTSLTHNLFLVYRKTGVNTLFLNLSGIYTQNKVVTNVILVKDSFNTVKQETHFLNANGDYSCRLSYSWSQQINDGKYNIFLDGTGSYNNNVLYMDDVRRMTQNLAITQAAKLNRLRKYLELTGSISYTYNRNIYILEENNITNLSTWAFNFEGKFYFLKSFSLGTDASKQINSGYSGAISTNPFIINGILEKMFLKGKLTCRLQCYNLLNERSRLSQSVSGNSVTQNRSNLLGRYFMLSLQYDLRKFK
jgi:hypothetical protein